MKTQYDPHTIEVKWQRIWEESGLYRTPDTSEKPRFYCLDFFPYPSGDGLSVGHGRNYVPTDVISRYYRMKGYNVLHPMGWDAFGFPAENYAIQTGIHPKISSHKNSENYKRQLKLLGTSYDWEREISSTHPGYYTWTQWFFLLMYKRGLAYRAQKAQWWCEKCRSILANEQVVGGCCWRHEDTPVTKKVLDQWFFKISDYAERLLTDLDYINWPENIKLMQRNWIGKSDGASVIFVSEQQDKIEVFTTRPDTLFGATFMVLAPEHPLVEKLTTDEQRNQVQAYVESATRQNEIDRLSTEKEKTGVFTGAYAINPVNNERIPIWIADYVLMDYGTGAIMCVPYGDQRDYEFAVKYGLEIRKIIEPENPNDYQEGRAYSDDGSMVNCGEHYNGMHNRQFYHRIVEWLEQRGLGKQTVNYKMRDWLISRQRYWGAPIPIIHCEHCGMVPVPEQDLPVLLPDIANFTPSGDGRSPLANVPEFVHTTCPRCGSPAKRETDTMDGFACSSWYFLRFPDPRNGLAPFDRDLIDNWLPVDLYVGGAEHAVMHLLYSRFWTKVMYDAGLIGFNEPFTMLRNQGMLHAADGSKMSKSKGNVITPDKVVEDYGIDILRLYLLFMAPFEDAVNWSDEAITGIERYLHRFYRLFVDHIQQFPPHPLKIEFEQLKPEEQALVRKAHQTIQKVTEEMERFHFNTAIAAMMELTNALTSYQQHIGNTPVFRDCYRSLLILMAPFAPYVTEEIWSHIGGKYSIHQTSWIPYNDDWTKEDMITLVVQINGKVRDKVEVVADVTEETARHVAMSQTKIQEYIADRKIIKVIYVPGRLVNIVVE